MLDVGLALLSHDVGCRNLSTCQSEVRNVSSVQWDNIYMVIHVVFLSWVCFQMVYDFVGHEFGVQFDILSCWMNHKPYLKSARARAIFLFFVCTQCLTLWSSGYWIGVTDAIAKQPVTAQGSLGTQTVRKIRLSGSIHHCSSNYLSMEARQRKWCWIRRRCL